MIGFQDLYSVLTAVVPLYVAMFLAYASVKWWNVFTPEQCAGINRFVAIFAVPLLSFEVVSRVNPYRVELLFIAADGVSKVLILVALFCWANFCKKGSLDWAITLFSLSTLPNTLVMGIPLLKSMYGDDKEGIMIQAVVLQCIIWYTLLLFLFEYRETRMFVLSKFREAGTCGSSTEDEVKSTPTSQNVNKVAPDSQKSKPLAAAVKEGQGKEVHLFIWRCGCCRKTDEQNGVCGQTGQGCQREERNAKVIATEKLVATENVEAPPLGSSSSGMLLEILRRVWFKLVRNPNSYASLFGLVWALISCRWGIKKPQIMENSVTILSKAGLGMAMFSLGLFMALQPRIIACGKRLAGYGMLARFVAGPALMAVASLGVGLRGTILKVSIIQAALPQGIVPFVFAREYNLHPEVLSTAVIFGMIISLPITILYYILLGI
ncbi:hypothetical protein SLA2020_256800 [Shorea laevis]